MPCGGRNASIEAVRGAVVLALLALCPRAAWAAEPAILAFRALPLTEVELSTADGSSPRYRVRGLDGSVTLPSVLCRTAPCEPYALTASAPLALHARAPRLPLRLRAAGEQAGVHAHGAGVAVRHAAHVGDGRCRVQLALASDERPEEHALVYDVEVPCEALEVATAAPRQPRVSVPRGFVRVTLASEPRALTLLDDRGGRVELELLRRYDICERPHIYGRRTGKDLELMLLGDGHWVRGRVPSEERAVYLGTHVQPTCLGGRARGYAPSVSTPEQKIVTLSPGTRLTTSRGVEVATVTSPVRAVVATSTRGVALEGWDRGADYLCASAADHGPCAPGLFVDDHHGVTNR